LGFHLSITGTIIAQNDVFVNMLHKKYKNWLILGKNNSISVAKKNEK